jgi:hypothetical protein
MERQARNLKISKHLTRETLIGEPEMVHSLAKYIDAIHRYHMNTEVTRHPTEVRLLREIETGNQQ